MIADGHHRYETSLAYRDERAPPTGAGRGRRRCAYVVELVEDQLTVQPIHRLLAGLPDGFDLVAALEPFFEIVERRPLSTSRSVDRMAEHGAPGPRDAATAPRSSARGRTPSPARATSTPSRLDVALADAPGPRARRSSTASTTCVRARRARRGRRPACCCGPATVEQIAATAHARRAHAAEDDVLPAQAPTGTVFRASASRRGGWSPTVPGGAGVQEVAEVAGALLLDGRRPAGG